MHGMRYARCLFGEAFGAAHRNVLCIARHERKDRASQGRSRRKAYRDEPVSFAIAAKGLGCVGTTVPVWASLRVLCLLRFLNCLPVRFLGVLRG